MVNFGLAEVRAQRSLENNVNMVCPSPKATVLSEASMLITLCCLVSRQLIPFAASTSKISDGQPVLASSRPTMVRALRNDYSTR
eukprot:20747-Heterococcus_DN1.PRE.3